MKTTNSSADRIIDICRAMGPATWNDLVTKVSGHDASANVLYQSDAANSATREVCQSLGALVRDGALVRKYASDPTQDLYWLA